MSTGAFLSVVAAARSPAKTPTATPTTLQLAGAFVLACVDDIPASVSLDFDQSQIQQAEREGYCSTSFWPWQPPSPENKKPDVEQWRLGRGYLRSYGQLPPTRTLAHSLRCPLLLIHGDQVRL